MAKSPAKPRAGRRTDAPAETATTSPDEAAVPPEAGAETATSEPAADRQDVPGGESPEEEREPAPGSERAGKSQADASEPSLDDAKSGEYPPEESGESERASSAGMVEAKLTQRWATGGRPHKAGDTVPMTRGTYERLKRYGRVE